MVGGFVYQKLKIEKLNKELAEIRLQLREKEHSLKLCKSNSKTFLENIEAKDKVIKNLQQNLKDNQRLCRKLLKDKEKLISNLQKIKTTKPKDIKPTVITKQNCKLKIETGEQLHEKDFIFDTLSHIGK